MAPGTPIPPLSQVRVLEDKQAAAKTTASEGQAEADRLRRRVAEAEGALAAADNRIALLDEAARKNQRQMEALSKELGETAAMKKILEGEMDGARSDAKRTAAEVARLMKVRAPPGYEAGSVFRACFID